MSSAGSAVAERRDRLVRRYSDLERDSARAREHWRESDELYSRRAVHWYRQITDGLHTPYRLSEVLEIAAVRFPGMLPDAAAMAREAARAQADKVGFAVDQGLFTSHVLADPACGAHLMDAMTRPLPRAAELLRVLRRDDEVRLGLATVRRRGRVGEVLLHNLDHLNAEDLPSNRDLELAVDLVLLDDRVQVGVLRGAPATHPKYAGRRIFSAGLNLKHLRRGEIPLVEFFLERELGVVNKLLRGHPVDGFRPAGLEVRAEKPWIGVLETFAIGGGAQFLLVTDQVVAEEGAYFTLPAGAEGIIPGVGGMRLARLVGGHRTREAVLLGARFDVDSPSGRALVTRVAAPGAVDTVLAETAAALIASGPVSVAANRRALRVAAEPQHVLRQALAMYARDQAACLHSPDLVANLDRAFPQGLTRSR